MLCTFAINQDLLNLIKQIKRVCNIFSAYAFCGELAYLLLAIEDAAGALMTTPLLSTVSETILLSLVGFAFDCDDGTTLALPFWRFSGSLVEEEGWS